MLSVLTLTALVARPVLAQSVFYDTFSGVLQDDVFLDLSAWRSDVGSYNGGQFGNTRITYGAEENGTNIYAQASTIAPGFFTARNYATLSVANSQDARYISQSSHGTRTTVQFFSSSAATPVRTRFKWAVTGTFFSGQSDVFGGGSLDFVAGNFPTTGYYDFFNLATQENGGPRLRIDGTGTAFYNIPTVLNQDIDLFYHSAAYVGKDASAGETFGGTADFRNTHTLERIDLYDASDNLIPSWGMRDMETGQVMFDQNGRTAAANGAAPEPGTLALLSLGIAASIPLRRRVSRK